MVDAAWRLDDVDMTCRRQRAPFAGVSASGRLPDDHGDRALVRWHAMVGVSRRRVRIGAGALAAVLVASSCNGSDAAPASTTAASTPPTDTSSPSTVDETPSTTTAGQATTPTTSDTSTPDTTTAATSSTSVPDTVTTVALTAEAAVAVTTWQSVVSAAAAGESLGAAASQRAADSFEALERFIGGALTFHTTAAVQPDGIAIEECLLSPASETGALLLRGAVSSDGSVVESVDFEDAFQGCIPVDVNEAVLAVYAEYSDAFVEFVTPPNPEDPRLDDYVAEPYRSFLGELLTALRADGEEVRGVPERQALVVRFSSADRVLVGDCQVLPPEYGVYVVATGERTDAISPILEGRTDYTETTMSLVGDRWFVSDVAVEADSPCEDVESRAVAVVGVAR